MSDANLPDHTTPKKGCDERSSCCPVNNDLGPKFRDFEDKGFSHVKAYNDKLLDSYMARFNRFEKDIENSKAKLGNVLDMQDSFSANEAVLQIYSHLIGQKDKILDSFLTGNDLLELQGRIAELVLSLKDFSEERSLPAFEQIDSTDAKVLYDARIKRTADAMTDLPDFSGDDADFDTSPINCGICVSSDKAPIQEKRKSGFVPFALAGGIGALTVTLFMAANQAPSDIVPDVQQSDIQQPDDMPVFLDNVSDQIVQVDGGSSNGVSGVIGTSAVRGTFGDAVHPVSVQVLEGLRFDINDATHLVEGENTLTELANRMMHGACDTLHIIGYADNSGAPEASLVLSERRAGYVMNRLIEEGVEPDSLSIEGKGQANFLRSNDTEEGRAYNRRVEVSCVALNPS